MPRFQYYAEATCHQWVIMPFSSFVFQVFTILLPIHRVCLTTGILQTVSLPVSRIVFNRISSRHNHYPWSRSGKSSCFPVVRGSLLLRRESSWREAGLSVHRRKLAVATFTMSFRMMPSKLEKS